MGDVSLMRSHGRVEGNARCRISVLCLPIDRIDVPDVRKRRGDCEIAPRKIRGDKRGRRNNWGSPAMMGWAQYVTSLCRRKDQGDQAAEKRSNEVRFHQLELVWRLICVRSVAMGSTHRLFRTGVDEHVGLREVRLSCRERRRRRHRMHPLLGCEGSWPVSRSPEVDLRAGAFRLSAASAAPRHPCRSRRPRHPRHGAGGRCGYFRHPPRPRAFGRSTTLRAKLRR